MHKIFLQIAAIIGAISVAMGAFGAHALKGKISDYAIGIFETGVKYQFYHVMALLIVGILYKDFANGWMLWSGRLFISGMIIFSGSLYILTFIKAAVKPGYDWVGAITPLGGLALIIGWICLFVGLIKK